MKSDWQIGVKLLLHQIKGVVLQLLANASPCCDEFLKLVGFLL